MKDKEIHSFRQELLRWYDKHQRDLPWRTTPNLYKTVLSEFMLQQTQVATVIPYFDRWLKKFPSFAALAKASESDVIKRWEGLGYYNRARNLHRLAKSLADRSTPPENISEWLELPGIGPYTAAAITSIAQNQPHPVIDGNVVRVFSRLKADATCFKNLSDGQRHFRLLAELLIDQKRPGDYNQAVMELGATICKPRSPSCLLCPVKTFCNAGSQGTAEDYPKIIKRKTEQITLNRLWVYEKGNILLQKTDAQSKRLAGIYELPLVNSEDRIPLPPLPIFTKKRGISNQRITENFFSIPMTALPKEMLQKQNLKFIPIQQIHTITLSGPHKKWILEREKFIDDHKPH